MGRKKGVVLEGFTFNTIFNGAFTFQFYYTGADTPVVDMGDSSFGTVVRSGTGSEICTVTHTYISAAEKTVTITVLDKSLIYRIGGVSNTFVSKGITQMNLSGLSIQERLQLSSNPLNLFIPPSAWSNAQAVDFVSITTGITIDLSGIDSFINNINSRIDITNSNINIIWPLACTFGPRAINVNNTSLPIIDLSGIDFNSAQPCRLTANSNVSNITAIIPPNTGPIGYTINGTSVSSISYGAAQVGFELNIRNVSGVGGTFIAGTQSTGSLFRTYIQNCPYSIVDLTAMNNVCGTITNDEAFAIINCALLNEIKMPSGVAVNTVASISIIGNPNLSSPLNLSHVKPVANARCDIQAPVLTSLTLWNNTNLIRACNWTGSGFGYIDLSLHMNYNVVINAGFSTQLILTNMNLTAADINKYLVDADTNSSFTADAWRVFTATGVNAAPDTTSGGFDGVAARASLIAKNWTVNTN